MKFKIIKHDKVSSTNDVAIELIKKKKFSFGCVNARIQEKGRGTSGNKWISLEGNLFCTIFFPLKNKFPKFNEFSIINPVIISDVIKKFCVSKKINLKFPNDIFVNGKKMCGILQEVISQDQENFLIIGIGINIVDSPEIKENYKATNILTETGKKPNIRHIISQIIISYEDFFQNIQNYDYFYFKEKANSMSLN